MAHLTTILRGDDTKQNIVKNKTTVPLQPTDDVDSFTTSVYSSSFAVADLPRHAMPDNEMPKEVAYQMIKDELSLDGNPILK